MKLNTRITGQIAILAGLFVGTILPAQAHFLWARCSAESPAKVRLLFSETPKEETTPTLLERIRPAKAWTADGQSLVLKSEKGARTASFSRVSHVVAARQTWGIFDRSAQKRDVFLLEYYAKGAATLGDASKSVKLPLEVFARRAGEQLLITVSLKGAPAGNAELVIDAPGAEKPVETVTDKNGVARIPLTGSGLFGVRAMVAEKRSGAYQGKSYSLVRSYSTLTFTISTGAVPSGLPTSADPAAYALLKSAHDSRQTVPDSFAGLTAQVEVNDQGKTAQGQLKYLPAIGVTLQIAGITDETRTWLRGELNNLIGHRRNDDFSKGEGKQPITFGDPDAANPLGRQVRLNDTMQSNYRIRDNQVVEVTRTMGDTRFTITMLETQTTETGKYLPRHFVVTYFQAKTGALQRVDSFTDSYAAVQGFWLPSSRRVITALNGKIWQRSFSLHNLNLLNTSEAHR